jgi:hypothetical protein
MFAQTSLVSLSMSRLIDIVARVAFCYYPLTNSRPWKMKLDSKISRSERMAATGPNLFVNLIIIMNRIYSSDAIY